MSASPSRTEPSLDVPALRRRIAEVGLRDERRLRRRLDQIRKQRDETRRAREAERLLADLATAEGRTARLRALQPRLELPPELPVSARADDIAAAIESHQVVVVAGETGSGKTTQLPRILLSLGRGVRGRIGHTQPRRIAARSVAARIAEECRTDLGAAVGYAVRFDDRTSDDTLVKVMTDGILLAEVRSDPMLRQYDTIVIDEAHERTLSIDFLLGYLKRLLPRRPDLKVVVTSATIDPDRFSALFDGAPVIEVSGRTYPVEVRYRPVAERDDDDPLEAIADAVEELGREGDGDVLVFLSGEREIRDAADVLERRRWRRTEVLPLYGRLSAAEQQRVFQAHPGRRIVLATNVAETSLTVPGIRYVVDTGTARISRYSQRLKVQRLPIEPVSQASAQQRAGRCGRLADGICIRLYAEEDLLGRPEFTDPEILRTNLASVVLQMAAADLGPVEDFPFMDPPDRRAVRDGVDLLTELGALEPGDEGRPRLTPTGRVLAGMPLDPRLARMLVEAERNGCLREVLVIVAGMSIQDPRERPADAQAAADAQHARFADKGSDFASYLRLWEHLRAQRKALSGSAFRRACRDEFLHYLRVREWQDVHGLLRQQAKDLGWRLDGPAAAADRIHQSLLSGLLSHVGLRDPEGRDFLGARGARFAVFPGSALAKRPPRWVMAGELVETSRLWARTVATVEPEWVERAAGHLVKRSHSEPHWSRKRAAVMARERVTLYGIPLAADRLVTYGGIDPETSRELFVRHALVEGDWETRHRFLARNRELLEEVEGLEDRVRRRDIRVDDETLFAFYDTRVGSEVVSGRHFDTWWKAERRERPDLLDLTLDDLVRDDAGGVDAEAFPTVWTSGGEGPELPLSYLFEPGAEADGVTVDVPLAVLPRLDEAGLSWNVPGRHEELVAALIRTLPKSWRRQFAPAPDHARRVLEVVRPGEEDLVTSVAAALRRLTGAVVPPEAFDPAALPAHLRPTYRVVDDGREVGRGKDLLALREQLRPQARSVLATAAPGLERTGLRTWDLGTVPRTVTAEVSGHEVTTFPALVDRGTSVDLVVTESADVQRARTRAGLARLLALTTPSPVPAIMRGLSRADTLVLATSPYASVADLLDDCHLAALEQLVDDAGGAVWDAEAFARLREHVRAEAHDATERVLRAVTQALHAWGEVRQALASASPVRAATSDDVRVQVSWLVYDGFVRETGAGRLPHLARYLRAAASRFADEVDPAADAARADEVRALEGELHELVDALPASQRETAPVLDVRWMLEELRVQTFAQRLRTAGPVSAKRVRRALEALRTR